MKKKILIIDDDKNMRRSLIRLLNLEKKYEIQEAVDGVEGEEKIKEFTPDLVILDIKMPIKGGYEVCINMRGNPETKHVKIVGISAFSGKMGDGIMSALGADYFFEKPFDNDKFRNKIAELLGNE